MPFEAGDNLCRVAGHKGPIASGIYNVVQFIFANRQGETHEIAYATPAGHKPAQLVRDLLDLERRKLWTVVYLKEMKGRLVIQTFKEPRESQEELWEQFRRRRKLVVTAH